MKKLPQELQKKDSFEIVPMLVGEIPEIKRLETESGLSAWSEEDYRKELKRKDSVALTAKVNGEIGGFLIARLIMKKNLEDTNLTKDSGTKKAQSRGEMDIYNLGVKTSFRRAGIGTKLLFECLERGRREMIKECWLEVRESNAGALEFYQKAGFGVVCKRKNFYRKPSEDALVMRLVLDDDE